MQDTIKEALPDMPGWAPAILALMGALNIVFVVALFQWKKWGFFGFVVVSVTALAVNLQSGVSPLQSGFGLLGITVLYAVLQIGGPKSGWAQLE
jgi:hypothetical protein